MRNIVTTYSGFSKVKGAISMAQLATDIASEKYMRIIGHIRLLNEEGKTDEMKRVKRQLAFFTVTTRYQTQRLPEGITAYNDLITIDIDELSDEEVIQFRPLIEQDPATILAFVTAKQHGFKIIAHLNTPAANELRKAFVGTQSISYEQLEQYHAQAYELTRSHYEQLLNVKVDTSGKDLSRGIFASYDPQAFFSSQRLQEAMEVEFPAIVPPTERAKRTKKKSVPISATISLSDMENIDPATHADYLKCLASTQRKIAYEDGTRNMFLFTLGNKCACKELDEATVKYLANIDFGEGGKRDTDTPIENGYRYSDKAKKASASQVPTVSQVLSYLGDHYEFRRDSILERLEMRCIAPNNSNTEQEAFRAMNNKDFNTIYLRISQTGISTSLQMIKAVIDSDYAKGFNPIKDYFEQLPPWDKETDYIAQLAQTIQTNEPEFWQEILRRWLVGMVACATQKNSVNQQVLLLHGGQGKGKSTWIQKLVPPELKEYYRNGMIDSSNKDELMYLTTRMLINMEEFEGVNQADIAELKRIITLDTISVRRPYEVQPQAYPRRASFIGSTNNLQFLKDITGSRRFLVITTKKIDYRQPINYVGLYSQAKYLLDSGFRHWFEGEEVEAINARNEKHRIKDPVEENLFVYFRRAKSRDFDVKWKPAATILSTLSTYGRIQVNTQSQQILVQVLEKNKFRKRRNQEGVTEYGVIILSHDEIDRNMRKQTDSENDNPNLELFS